jgi:hypothetical protein
MDILVLFLVYEMMSSAINQGEIMEEKQIT